jgi:Phosphodiester glycosidase
VTKTPFDRWLLFAILAGITVPALAQEIPWKLIQTGVQFASIPAGKMMSGAPGRLYVVRVDPARARLTVALASEAHIPAQTAAKWCQTSKLAVAINLGMFQTDGRSNVGYLRHGTHSNNPQWNDYNAVLAVNPSDRSHPAALWIDRDQTTAMQQLADYDIVVQNLRLVTTKRGNVWSESNRRWSEAAVAIDSKGRILFIFSRAPYSMREFNNLLLALPLDIAGAMHVEGGPEASLSIHAGGINLDLAGSYETGFWPNDSNQKQWAIPNVLGVVAGK